MVNSLDCYKKWGNPLNVANEGKYMVLWKVPKYIRKSIPTIPQRIYCNYEMMVILECAFLNIIDNGLEKEVKTWDGCFNVRPVRGYEKRFEKLLKEGNIETAMTLLSLHAWGCAIDINAAWNGLGKEPSMNKELVKCFTDAGFDWGGNFKRKDGMHFQPDYLSK